jgi:glutamine amidotransferase
MICVVDFKAGNLKSVELALQFLGAQFLITNKPEEISRADKVIFPGVGEAFSAMSALLETGAAGAIKKFYTSGKPLLGICIGCQVTLDSSEERNTTCLGIIPGQVVRFPLQHLAKDGKRLKVPHMGWNQVQHQNRHPLFKGIPENSSFYFVHSYYPHPAKAAHSVGETEYGLTFTSAVAANNLFAVQFHPEKSGKWGLKLIQNFLEWKV